MFIPENNDNKAHSIVSPAYESSSKKLSCLCVVVCAQFFKNYYLQASSYTLYSSQFLSLVVENETEQSILEGLEHSTCILSLGHQGVNPLLGKKSDFIEV